MQNGVIIEERDFFADRFSEEELRALMQGREIRELFAWRSPSFKAMGLDPDSLSDDELVRLMLQEPRFIRRPLTQIGDRLVAGGSEKDLAAALEQ